MHCDCWHPETFPPFSPHCHLPRQALVSKPDARLSQYPIQALLHTKVVFLEAKLDTTIPLSQAYEVCQLLPARGPNSTQPHSILTTPGFSPQLVHLFLKRSLPPLYRAEQRASTLSGVATLLSAVPRLTVLGSHWCFDICVSRPIVSSPRQVLNKYLSS